MATASTSLMTADEFYDFVHRPENRDRHFELEEGEVVEMSRPGQLHCAVCGNIAGLFFMYCRQINAGCVCPNDMGLILEKSPDTVRGPDVAVYTDTESFRDLSRKYPDTFPTLVVEVLSPNDRASVTIRRLNRFLDHGVSVVWMVDPEANSVTLWWPGRAPLVLEENEEISDLPGLPGFRCRVSELFGVKFK